MDRDERNLLCVRSVFIAVSIKSFVVKNEEEKKYFDKDLIYSRYRQKFVKNLQNFHSRTHKYLEKNNSSLRKNSTQILKIFSREIIRNEIKNSSHFENSRKSKCYVIIHTMYGLFFRPIHGNNRNIWKISNII